MTTARTEPAPRPDPPRRRPGAAPVGLGHRPARRPHPAARPVPARLDRAPGQDAARIAATAIARYTEPGDLVADPMCGIGTTLVEAIHLGRDGLGVEYEDRWAEVAAANVAHARRQGAAGSAEVIRGDARLLPGLLPEGRRRAGRPRRHLPALRPVRSRAGRGRAAARHRRRGPQVRQPLRARPGQPGQPGPGRAARRVHRDPVRLRGAAAARRAGGGHRPALAAARRAGRPARRRHRGRRPRGPGPGRPLRRPARRAARREADRPAVVLPARQPPPGTGQGPALAPDRARGRADLPQPAVPRQPGRRQRAARAPGAPAGRPAGSRPAGDLAA